MDKTSFSDRHAQLNYRKYSPKLWEEPISFFSGGKPINALAAQYNKIIKVGYSFRITLT